MSAGDGRLCTVWEENITIRNCFSPNGEFNVFMHMDYLNYKQSADSDLGWTHTWLLSFRYPVCSCVCALHAACLCEHGALSVTLPGVDALTLSSLRAGPWLCRQRWAGLWHWSVPTSDEPWCCWPERLGLDWVSGGLGAWGTGTGPQGNLLLWEERATCYCRDKPLEQEATSIGVKIHFKKIYVIFLFLY